jgi:hypothetical protein
MSIEIHFDGHRVTNGDAPYNDKLGDAGSLTEAIDKARAAHQRAGGKKEQVDNEDVVVIANGDNMWATWEKYGKPHGVNWEDFLQSNLHLKDPKNLRGSDQGGWKDWSLVHKGDVVFIPDGPSGGQPATVSNGTNSGPLVKRNGTWQFEMKDEAGRSTYHDVARGQTLIIDAVRYTINKIDGDNVEVQRLKPDGKPDGNPQTFDLNKLT